jgi:hypothetical protein
VGDGFSAVASIGDLDGDGVTDLAVGAQGDQDGGQDRGAVWILFLNRDGTVKGHQKVSDTEGGFTGTLDDSDFFGAIVAHVGDLDGNDRAEIAVMASGDDDGGTDRGAIWILFLNADGTVASHQKISDTEGNFTGTLLDGNPFAGPAGIGDLDGDDVPDLAAGVPFDDDGGTDRGAVWILFLNANGTVKGHQKISSTSGGLVGPLADGDFFGSSLESLGDLDGAGASARALAVGAWQDDQAGSTAGAVWVLYLSASGTVLSQRKITEGIAGFTGDLDAGDGFGVSVANLGNLSATGTLELAVGAFLDDDGVADAGAIWVLTLDSTAGVLAQRKISATQGNFQGSLDASDRFGTRLTSLGDLDLDGRTDLATGVPSDDDGGVDEGAVYVLFLNDGTLPLGAGTTRWTGAINRTWTNAGNWTNGVPTSTKSAIIPDVANDPLVADSLQSCQGLLLRPGGALELNGSFAVHGGGTIHGTVPGTGELHAAGTGVATLAGRGTVSVLTVLDQDVAIQGGPLTIGNDLDANADLIVELASELDVTGGLVVQGDLTIEGDLTVSADCDIEGNFQGGSTSSLSAGGIHFGGDIEHGGSLSTSQAIVITEPSPITLVVDVSDPLPADLDIDVGGRVVLASSLTVLGDLQVLDGTLAAGTSATIDVDALVIETGAALETENFIVSFPGAPAITVRGELAVEPGGTLRLSASTVSIQSGGKLRVESATVRGVGGGGYALTVGAGATLAAREFLFQNMGSGGVVVHRDALLGPAPLDLRTGLFTRGAAGGVLLHIERSAAVTLRSLRFENPLGTATKNVRVPATSAPITLLYWSGGFAGPAFEDDPLGEPGLLVWSASSVRQPPPPPVPPQTTDLGAGGGAPPPVVPGKVRGGGSALDLALSILDPGTAGELVVEAGSYRAFRFDGGLGRALRLVTDEHARIDTRRGPVVIRGLEPGEVLELSGFELVGGATALLVTDSRGAVRLERCRIDGEVRLAAAAVVLLDECAGEALVLERGSRAQVRGGALESVELLDRSRLDSWGLAPSAFLAPGSRWLDHGPAWPRLDLVSRTPHRGLGLELPPGSIGWIASSGVLDLSGSSLGWALPLGELVPLGFLSAGETLPLSGSLPRFFQALVLDLRRNSLATSNLVGRY